jgi:AcrR family transcriptional regulator
MPTEAVRRKYQSALREEQAAATQARILDAAIDVLVEQGAQGMSHRAIARRAGVSAPLVSRYFPTTDDVVAGIDARITERLGFVDYPRTVDELVTLPERVYTAMDREERAMLAYLAAPGHRAYGRQRRKQGVERTVDVLFAGATPTERRRVAALVHLLISSGTWSHFRDSWGMSGAEAGQVVRFALEAILATIAANKGGT